MIEQWRRDYLFDAEEAKDEMRRTVCLLKIRRRFDLIDGLLSSVDPADFGDDFLISLLTVTAGCAPYLDNRPAYFASVRDKLVGKVGTCKAARLLLGLACADDE